MEEHLAKRRRISAVQDLLGDARKPFLAFWAEEDGRMLRMAWGCGIGGEKLLWEKRREVPRSENHRPDLALALDDLMADVFQMDLLHVDARLLYLSPSHRETISSHLLLCVGMRTLEKYWQCALTDALCMTDGAIKAWVVQEQSNLSPQLVTILRGRTHPLSVGECIGDIFATLFELQRRVIPSCCLRGGKHQVVQIVPSGPRDNGEYEYRCELCNKNV